MQIIKLLILFLIAPPINMLVYHSKVPIRIYAIHAENTIHIETCNRNRSSNHYALTHSAGLVILICLLGCVRYVRVDLRNDDTIKLIRRQIHLKYYVPLTKFQHTSGVCNSGLTFGLS